MKNPSGFPHDSRDKLQASEHGLNTFAHTGIYHRCLPWLPDPPPLLHTLCANYALKYPDVFLSSGLLSISFSWTGVVFPRISALMSLLLESLP